MTLLRDVKNGIRRIAFEGILNGLATSKCLIYSYKDSFKLKVPIIGKEYELEKELFKPFLMG